MPFEQALTSTTAAVAIECTKEGVKFACNGDIGSGSVQLRSHSNVDKPAQSVEIALSEPVALTFSLKYLVNFCKSSGLSDCVKLCVSIEVPLLVEYEVSGNSHLRFYLAPKVGHRPFNRLHGVICLLTWTNTDRGRRIGYYEVMSAIAFYSSRMHVRKYHTIAVGAPD